MLLLNRATAPKPTPAVLAYDIGCPRRAYRARKILYPLHHAKQYSVFELCLGESMLRGVLAELCEVCDPQADRLTMWRPHQALRLSWVEGEPMAHTLTGERVRSFAASCGRGNFVVCYDISSNPETLRGIWARIASRGAMLQRSVYWLRCPFSVLQRTLASCASLLTAEDRIWAYPLAGADSLWNVAAGTEAQYSGLLPLATHRWVSREN